ncbi:MAG: cyclohexanecarboxyl-CoA dehydrogenase [Rhodospirillaceae bacterium]|jgi:acyl-CoA dehydrogenase|nr:cyclohexanecarboxyl-CoA dehydrogenase [Rhodospirillaceae bacterium]MBT5898508.1 cyclohexanecarboxyl-CoA dehydrogenase [Rhodospirillaceae bacterium]MBT6430804.1 cyclohexanecarboxyl-CoA dehydrogenase [Rhodospirillaceae bacterium]MBT7760228.1 cyclohexanecarboxyl-CoA dehydrogenase [Rhodospirillaceae bacterium]
MDLSLTEEQQLIVDMVRRFVREEVAPLEDDLDTDEDRLPPEQFAKLVEKTKEMGLYGLGIPPEYGGPEVDVMTNTLIAIEYSQHRAGLYAPCYGAFGGAGLSQLYEATDEQKEKYLYPTLRGEKKTFFGLSEPSGGSDPARAIQTRAERDGDDWVINGSKLWISGADRADYGLLFARTGGPGRAGVTCFIVETQWPGFNVRRVVHTLRQALHATEIQIENLRVPNENILGQEGGGFAIANDRLTRQRIPYAAACLGPAFKAHEMAIEYAQIRETFGAPLSSRQGIQWMLVENEVDLRTARWLVLDAAAKADRGDAFRTEAAICKLVASEAAGRVIDRSMQIHGGLGVAKDLPFERWYREIRIRRIGEGPSEVQKHVIARDILGAGLR